MYSNAAFMVGNTVEFNKTYSLRDKTRVEVEKSGDVATIVMWPLM